MSATPGRIDVTFDLRTDAGGKDPDSHSPTLREYHRLLWSKELPSGRRIEFDTHTRGAYLHHDSDLGPVVLSSDIIVVSLSYLRQMAALEKEIRPSLLNRFARSYRTIGGYLVFPANRIGGKMTINGAKGFHPRIKDRSDLTLECIRRTGVHDFRCGTWQPDRSVGDAAWPRLTLRGYSASSSMSTP